MLKKWMSLLGIMCMFLLSGCQGVFLVSDDNANNLRKKNSDQMNTRGNNVDSRTDRGKNKQHMVEDDIRVRPRRLNLDRPNIENNADQPWYHDLDVLNILVLDLYTLLGENHEAALYVNDALAGQNVDIINEVDPDDQRPDDQKRYSKG